MLLTLIIVFLLVVNNVNAQTQTDCSLSSTPSTNTVAVCPLSNNIYKGKQTKSPTVTTAYNCEYCDVYDMCLTTAVGRIGGDQTASDYIVFGNAGPTPQAATVPTSSSIIIRGVTEQFYTADCGVPNLGDINVCTGSALFTGTNRCLCASPPTISTNTRISNDQNLGYAYDQSAGNDKFFPQAVGHYIIHHMCMGSGLASDAAIIILTGTGATVAHSRKSAVGGYISLSNTVVVTFNTVGGATDYIFTYCANCETGQFNYCGFTALRVG